MKLTERATNKPQFKIGINQNYYVYCKELKPLEKIANQIGKSTKSIYFNSKYQVYTIRVKLKKHKEELKKLKDKLL